MFLLSNESKATLRPRVAMLRLEEDLVLNANRMLDQCSLRHIKGNRPRSGGKRVAPADGIPPGSKLGIAVGHHDLMVVGPVQEPIQRRVRLPDQIIGRMGVRVPIGKATCQLQSPGNQIITGLDIEAGGITEGIRRGGRTGRVHTRQTLLMTVDIFKVRFPLQRKSSILKYAIYRIGRIIHDSDAQLPAVTKRGQLSPDVQVGQIKTDKCVI